MKNRLIADMHTHTLASGHAYGTIREMAQAASERGIALLGLTEHAPGIPGTVHPFYYNNLEVVPRTLYGTQILHGCEINVLNDGTLSLEQRYIDKLDYALCGFHVQCYTDAGREKNTENVIECMKHPKVFFVSHPDDDHTPIDYEPFVLAAKEYHVAPELNNSSLRKCHRRLNCIENYRTLLALCMKHGVPITVNTDAHDPSEVGNFSLAEAFLNEIGFDEELILNTDVQKMKDFIGIR